MSAADRNYRQLKVWAAAHEFTLGVYAATSNFPGDERFGLTSQLRRASISIASNLVEGCSRSTDASYAAFVDNAHGSASESEYYLLLARDIGYLDETGHATLAAQLDSIRRMLASLRRVLRKNGRHT